MSYHVLLDAPGTSLYNEKKRESQRIIEKKEEKVKEMNDLLKTEIEPQMEKLRRV
jgi:structural maintenance of chromosome 2